MSRYRKAKPLGPPNPANIPIPNSELLIELSRLKEKNNEMETTIKQLKKEVNKKDDLTQEILLLKSLALPIMEIKNGTHLLEIYPHSETMKTTTKLRSAIKEFMKKN
tara:strand:- start:510 stop:830 length:321 start_codon:yes stop_codon:yes gene_type:complete